MSTNPEDHRWCDGVDPDFKGAFPGGPPAVPEEAARMILSDPAGVAAKIAQKMRELRAKREKSGE